MPEAVDAFNVRWENAGGTERANYQLFLTETALTAQSEDVVVVTAKKAVWPKAMRDQVAAVCKHLEQQPHTAESLATCFKRKPVGKVASAWEARWPLAW